MKQGYYVSEDELKNRFENICSLYIQKMEEKNEITFAGWVGDIIGGVAEFDEGYYLNFDDIVYDINEKIPPNTIKEWFNKTFEYIDININYYSFSKGASFEEIRKIKNEQL
jgi:hypothetical protein